MKLTSTILCIIVSLLCLREANAMYYSYEIPVSFTVIGSGHVPTQTFAVNITSQMSHSEFLSEVAYHTNMPNTKPQDLNILGPGHTPVTRSNFCMYRNAWIHDPTYPGFAGKLNEMRSKTLDY